MKENNQIQREIIIYCYLSFFIKENIYAIKFCHIITINIETGKEEEKFIKKQFPVIEKYNEVKNFYILKILYDENKG